MKHRDIATIARRAKVDMPILVTMVQLIAPQIVATKFIFQDSRKGFAGDFLGCVIKTRVIKTNLSTYEIQT